MPLCELEGVRARELLPITLTMRGALRAEGVHVGGIPTALTARWGYCELLCAHINPGCKAPSVTNMDPWLKGA